jgi:MFS family permease
MMTAEMTPDTEEYRGQVRRAAVASVIGTAIEWYDFFLYGTMAALVFPVLFFPQSDPYVGTQFLGFVARPVGAAIFGHYGDRLGRKATLITTLLLMGVATFLIGVLPGYNTLGLGAALLLILLRVLQGIGVGGEWGGSVLLSMEWGHRGGRGLAGSWAQMGVPAGLLLSTGVFSLVLRLTGESFNTWGWRVPFLLSAVLVIVGLGIRLAILETPLFSRLKTERRVARQPLLEVLRRHPRAILLSALLRMSEQAPFYIFITFVLTYGTSRLGFSRGFLANATSFAAAISLFTVPFAGYLSDRIGRRRLYVIGAVATLLFAVPYFALLDTKVAALVVLAIVLSLVVHDLQYGPQAAYIAESFPTRLRYSGASLGYQLASIIAGGPAPLVATYLLKRYNTGYAISAYIIANAVLTLLAAALLADRSGAALDTADGDQADGRAPAAVIGEV